MNLRGYLEKHLVTVDFPPTFSTTTFPVLSISLSLSLSLHKVSASLSLSNKSGSRLTSGRQSLLFFFIFLTKLNLLIEIWRNG